MALARRSQASSSSRATIHDIDRSSDSSNHKKQIAHLKPYRKIKHPQILQMSAFPPNTILSGNNFAETVEFANRNHINFINSADDFWAAIMTQFSFYINKNAESFRHKFVSFKGRKTLKVRVQGKLTSEIYNQFVIKMTKKIGENLIASKFKEWMFPNFTTTTEDTRVTFGVILMATMKRYFRYRLWLKNDLPKRSTKLVKRFKIKNGEEGDRLLTKLEKLRGYQLNKWCDLLKGTFNFLMSGDDDGNVGLDYWKKICNFEEGRGDSSCLSGWMTVFCGFSKTGHWRVWESEKKLRIYIDDVPRGIVKARVTIRGDTETGVGTGGGCKRKSIMTAGHMGLTQNWNGEDARSEVEPVLGWAIALKHGMGQVLNKSKRIKYA